MATYKEIQEYVKNLYGYTPKTCWIAHMKEISGLKPKVANNRHSINSRTHPCPIEKQKDIKEALLHFNML
ncbi:hypothetical protein [Pseudoneobacillus sp. C159]